ncbi:U5 small nuclear ribonucleoprotein 200 kDa helicase, partial [Aduncisulcus paluster]
MEEESEYSYEYEEEEIEEEVIEEEENEVEFREIIETPTQHHTLVDKFENIHEYVDLPALRYGSLAKTKNTTITDEVLAKLSDTTVITQHLGFEDVYIPPPEREEDKEIPLHQENTLSTGTVKYELYPNLISISSLPKYAQVPFKGSSITQLNRVQSHVCDAALYDSDNMLICAPTGAGKTNVALLTILNIILPHINPQSGKVYPQSSREVSIVSSDDEDGTISEGKGDDSYIKIKVLHDNPLLLPHDFKIVYLAPMKSLVREQAENLRTKLMPLGINVEELSGDSVLPSSVMAKTHVLVATPEKWDVVTRRGLETSTVASVQLLILDEIHLLHDSRGPVLESLVARHMRYSRSFSGSTKCRFVGLSATLPNYQNVATFLHVPKKNVFTFSAKFRPTPLHMNVIGVDTKTESQLIKDSDKIAYGRAMDALSEKRKQVIVFVHSRKESHSFCEFIRDRAEKDGASGVLMSLFSKALSISTRNVTKSSKKDEEKDEEESMTSSEGESMDESEEMPFIPAPDTADNSINPQRYIRKVVSPALKALLPHGVGFHHAGLCRTDREVVEDLFRAGFVSILVSTATLAWGVNLPAHTVIIKGTRVFSPDHGQFVDLGFMDVLQMIGRAGRPQFDSEGHGIIITRHSDLGHYVSVFTQKLECESRMYRGICEHVCSEIALGAAECVSDIADWLGDTYLHVRCMFSPHKYGVPLELHSGDSTLLEWKRGISVAVCEELVRKGVCRWVLVKKEKEKEKEEEEDENKGIVPSKNDEESDEISVQRELDKSEPSPLSHRLLIKPTILGIICTRYHLTVDSIHTIYKALCSHIPPQSMDSFMIKQGKGQVQKMSIDEELHPPISSLPQLDIPTLSSSIILNILSLSDEFKQITVRDSDIKDLEFLMLKSPIPLSNPLSHPSSKLSLLFQALVSNVPLSRISQLAPDLTVVHQSASRVLQAIHDVCADAGGWENGANLAHSLSRCMKQRMWSVWCPLRQIKSIVNSDVREIERFGIPWAVLRGMNVPEIKFHITNKGGAVRMKKPLSVRNHAQAGHDPSHQLAMKIHTFSKRVPQFHLRTFATTVDTNTVKISVKIRPSHRFVFSNNYHGNNISCIFRIHSSNRILVHSNILCEGWRIKECATEAKRKAEPWILKQTQQQESLAKDEEDSENEEEEHDESVRVEENLNTLKRNIRQMERDLDSLECMWEEECVCVSTSFTVTMPTPFPFFLDSDLEVCEWVGCDVSSPCVLWSAVNVAEMTDSNAITAPVSASASLEFTREKEGSISGYDGDKDFVTRSMEKGWEWARDLCISIGALRQQVEREQNCLDDREDEEEEEEEEEEEVEEIEEKKMDEESVKKEQEEGVILDVKIKQEAEELSENVDTVPIASSSEDETEDSVTVDEKLSSIVSLLDICNPKMIISV